MATHKLETVLSLPSEQIGTEKIFELSAIDLLMPKVLVPHLFIYPLANSTEATRRHVMKTMAAGLEKTAAQVPIMSGRFHYADEQHPRAYVKVAAGVDNQGLFLLARGISDVVADTPSYMKLEEAHFPSSPLVMETLLPLHLFKASVTVSGKPEEETMPAGVFQMTFIEGGVILGAAVHHAIADGPSIDTFLKLWATNSRGLIPTHLPNLDRSILHSNEEIDSADMPEMERQLASAGGLALESMKPNTVPTRSISRKFRPANIRIATDACEELRAKLSSHHAATSVPKLSISDCLVAFIWRNVSRAKATVLLENNTVNESSSFTYAVGLRGARNDAFPPDYFGNAVAVIRAGPLSIDSLIDPDYVSTLSRAATDIRQKVQRVDMHLINDLLAWANGVVSKETHVWARNIPLMSMNITSWAGNTCYETYDFGFGLPQAFRLPSINIEWSGIFPRIMDATSKKTYFEVYLSLEEACHDILKTDKEFRVLAEEYILE